MKNYFINRAYELHLLRDAFLNGVKLAIIHGRAGIGKTALAHHFASMSKKTFSGSIIQKNYFDQRSLNEILYRNFKMSIQEPSLLIVDDVHKIEPNIRKEIINLFSKYPYLKIILTSRELIDIPEVNHIKIELSGLKKEFFKILIGYFLHEKNIDKCWEYVAGNPLLGKLGSKLINDKEITWNQFFHALENFETSGILGPDGKLLSKDSTNRSKIIKNVAIINDEIISIMKSDPKQLYNLSSRKFEELIAELLYRKGFQVELSPPIKDGGIDIYAAKNDAIGKFLFLVECKRYTPPNKVGVSIVRSLYGVVQEQKANAGIIVTTSYFTTGQKSFRKN